MPETITADDVTNVETCFGKYPLPKNVDYCTHECTDKNKCYNATCSRRLQDAKDNRERQNTPN